MTSTKGALILFVLFLSTHTFAQMSDVTWNAKWIGSGRGPHVLAGIETRLRLEKHRHKKTGESAKVFFEVIP